jgi:hypothetical protein
MAVIRPKDLPAVTAPAAGDKLILDGATARSITVENLIRNTSYLQSETGAAASPLIRRLNNTLFASEFGAVGDDATNDATAVQNFLTAVATSGKEGRFDPGKSYYVSGADMLLAQAAGVKNTALYGFGSQIRTDPTQTRYGLKIQRTAPVTRADETRKIVVDGLRISQYQDANAQGGFLVVGSAFVTLRNCTVICGSDNATVPFVNYAAYYFLLSNPVDPNTGCFWSSIDTCAVKGGATWTPAGIRLDGQSANAMHITNTSVANATKGVWYVRAATGLNANEAGLAVGSRITNCDFEGCTDAIATLGTVGWSTLPGLLVSGNRAETVTNFFNYSLNLNPAAGTEPVIGPNYLAATVTNNIVNPNNLIVRTYGNQINNVPIGTSAPQAGTFTTLAATTQIGYATGAGGTVTQATSKATGVTLNTASGQITMNNAALAAGAIVSFVLTDSAIAATDVLILNHISGGTPGSYSLNARAAAGSATIDVRNNSAGSLSEAIVIQFALIKAVNA